jgi:hypothetical protein
LSWYSQVLAVTVLHPYIFKYQIITIVLLITHTNWRITKNIFEFAKMNFTSVRKCFRTGFEPHWRVQNRNLNSHSQRILTLIVCQPFHGYF